MRLNGNALGIVNTRGENEIFLDDVVFAIDEWEEQKRAKREELIELDRRLATAGKEIRANSHGRELRSEEGGIEDGNVPNEVRKGRARHAVILDYEAEEWDLIWEHIVTLRDMEERRVRLDEERLSMDRDQDQCIEICGACQHEHTAKRLGLDEKLIELEEKKAALQGDERREALKERKKMIAMPGALVKKLQ
ncbi:hypothetical protein BWQ96_09179 [Gracilariopsis chorda]|uniref:Uncharacterized protein n=1 Tax=Gracilariopsis chorda TaxID=448386 RepID=A0A2V3IJ04_9FLOR|nr:hypothetical protein BWQ96_09179 [Gracilariopsis chorda]|eukprot:PXF41100.1 hypothetical protein BWQ96_09179 [Gracilariopsis chorda]